jgi:excinuclease UvrABC nuclease subunit
MIDIIRHHFEKDEIDEDTMIASFSSEFWTFHLEEGFYSTVRFPWNKEERQRILKLFDDFFESYLLVNTIQWSWIMNDLLQELQNRYNLEQFPYQVECLDISHLWW